MKESFAKSTGPLSPAETALKEWGVAYAKQPDGMLVVEGSIHLSFKKLYTLPDLTNVIVKGDFYCDSTRLDSLKGAPRIIGGGFFCGSNQLTDLKGAPQRVGGDFYCACNPLKSLEGAPQRVGGNFSCEQTPLTSLRGAPRDVGGHFLCGATQLTSLEYAPGIFKTLSSRFGKYESWSAIPPALRFSPGAIAQREGQRRTDIERSVKNSTELGAPLTVRRPLQLRKPPGSV